jgi:hypothetical protein
MGFHALVGITMTVVEIYDIKHGTIRCKRDVVAVLLFGFGQQAVVLLPVSARQEKYHRQ